MGECEKLHESIFCFSRVACRGHINRRRCKSVIMLKGSVDSKRSLEKFFCFAILSQIPVELPHLLISQETKGQSMALSEQNEYGHCYLLETQGVIQRLFSGVLLPNIKCPL